MPIAVEIKQPIRNRPTTEKDGGTACSASVTVLSAPPAALTIPENAPAARKMRHIVMMFSSASPRAMTLTFSSKLRARFCRKATNSAIRNPTMAGMT